MGTMGTTEQSITLANSIIGVGILAMPFCYQQCGIILATVILLLMGLVSRLCCYFLLKSALIARKRTFEFLAFHVFGPAGKLAVEVGIIGFLMGTCIAYFVVVGDLGPQIIAKLFNINQSDILRTSLMVVVSLACVLPLGLLRDVQSLGSVSAATLAFYFCLLIKIACEAAARAARGGLGSLRLWRAAGVLQCVPVLCMALFCQTQLFEVFSALPALSLERMSAASARAIHLCSAVYCALGVAGYAAFADQAIPGNVLRSLSSSTDSDVIRLGFVLSVCASFPLVIFPCRASLYSFLYRRCPHEQSGRGGIPERAFRRLTAGIVAASLAVSLLLPSVEAVLGLIGSTVGVLVCLVFPAACFVRLTFKDTNERILAKLTVVLGLSILVLGTLANLQALSPAAAPAAPAAPAARDDIDRIVEDFFQAQKLAEHRETLTKPVLGKENISPEVVDGNSKAVDKDSDLQPPNPLPPESSDDGKNNILNLNVEPKPKESGINSKLQDKVEPKEHQPVPKELDNKDSLIPEQPDKQVKLKPVEENPQETEKNRQILQHKQLIETIKQHGKEQKELLKEQKEILHEMHKTKKEMDQNIKETGEGNKVAVESIQKIANVAIQSLTASEAPLDDVKNNDVLNEIADEAVQEIAKKALESIVAIQEVKEKARDDVQVRNAIIGNPPVMESKQENTENNNKIPVNLRKNIKKLANLATLAIKHNITLDSINGYQEVQNPLGPVQAANKAPVDTKVAAEGQKIVNQLVNNQANPNNEKKTETKEHSHAVEEPQSYKVGEDMQKNKDLPPIVKNSIPNVPIPLAMRDMRISNNDVKVKDVQNRQKREVVDCTDPGLKLEDRRICDALVVAPADALPSKFDFNDVLAKNVDINMIHRSLKSVRKD